MGNEIAARAILSQLLASLYTLKDCMDRCPVAEWHETHRDYPFSQLVFHTLFDCDYGLSDNEEEFKLQAFHRANPQIFHDYPDLENLVPLHLYEADFTAGYYEHCRLKAIAKIEPKTISQLVIPKSDVRQNMTKLERYINVVRHVQHHAGQLALTLQLLDGTETGWISWGLERE